MYKHRVLRGIQLTSRMSRMIVQYYPLNTNPRFCRHDVIRLYQYRNLLIDGIAVHFGTAGLNQSRVFKVI
jgi:hypothetical protein